MLARDATTTGGGSAAPARGSALQRLQEDYLRRLDDTVVRLADDFMNLLRVAKVSERQQNERENFNVDVQALHLVTGGETLMKMITELKHSILINDFETINENVERLTDQYKNNTSRMIPHIHTLNREITDALFELENEYYSSSFKVNPELQKPLLLQ